MPLGQQDDIHPAVVSPALGAVIGGQRHGVRKTRHLKLAFIHTEIHQVVEYIHGAGVVGNKLSVQITRKLEEIGQEDFEELATGMEEE